MAANMPIQKLHAGEVDSDGDLVARLIATQFPQWADLPLQPVASAGTVHALYQLGNELVVRLSRLGVSDEEVAKEHAWLPRLAPCLPVAIPVPHGRGVPAEGYPYTWSVYS